MSRNWIWLQVLLGWLPVGVLFAVMFKAAHGGPVGEAIAMAVQLMLVAALLGVFVYRFTQRVPWPHPLRGRFVATHLLAAAAYAICWSALNVLIASMIASLLRSIEADAFVLVLAIGPGWGIPYMILGVWLYVMVAGIAYANGAAQRHAQIEALAARTQLAALRAQLHPHLLFNALHTVVQLIPEDPKRAMHAAEQLAGILRTALSEQRDVVTLAEEWAFVQRYLAIETLRFGARLQVESRLDADALAALVPAFALQTLVENAVRHAAAPRIDATHVSIRAQNVEGFVELVVADDGAGASDDALASGSGTGLKRLRERVLRLCGSAGNLAVVNTAGRGFQATLRLPQRELRTALLAAHADDA